MSSSLPFVQFVHSLLLKLGMSALLPTPIPAQTQITWQEWVRTNPTYQSVPAVVSPRSQPRQPIATKPVRLQHRRVIGVPVFVTTIDLADPQTFLAVGLPRGVSRANSSRFRGGQETFPGFVSRLNAAVVVNGTFFSPRANMQVMGNLVSGGQFLKYVPWENYGTTLGVGPNKRPQMTTARLEGRPNWDDHWFSITGGPRLLRQGQVWLHPRAEGFTDSRVMGIAKRTAIGYNSRYLYLATFTAPISLQKQAQIMRTIGCTEAMNLDGGSSTGLAYRGRTLVTPGRGLTNVIAVYDFNHPATTSLRNSWQRFNAGERFPFGETKPSPPLDIL